MSIESIKIDLFKGEIKGSYSFTVKFQSGEMYTQTMQTFPSLAKNVLDSYRHKRGSLEGISDEDFIACIRLIDQGLPERNHEQINYNGKTLSLCIQNIDSGG
ncbi:hypothetical protein Herod_00061 [Acinetobacter phage Herod]|nr:hypothetical protein Herod_00061 [Acinetobacter phage Herod]